MSRSRRARIPNPLRRLLRQPLRAAAIVLLAVTALAATGIQSAAESVLQTTIASNWRGAYDVLVTPPDALAPINGKLPPNTLTSTGEGMTLAQLAKVRKVPGVEIAAPIAQILIPDTSLGSTDLSVPKSVLEESAKLPQAYRIDETYTTNDGLGERVVASDQFNLILDQGATTVSEADLAKCEATADISYGGDHGQYHVDPTHYPEIAQSYCEDQFAFWDIPARITFAAGSPLNQQGTIYGATSYDASSPVVNVTLPDKLQTVTRVTLVDPEAEKKLLGKSGNFLDPLIAINTSRGTGLAAMRTWAKANKSRFTAGFEKFVSGPESCPTPPSANVLTELRALYAANHDDYDSTQGTCTAGDNASDSIYTYVPLIVSQQPVAQATVKLNIEDFGPAAKRLDDATGLPTYDLPAGINAAVAGGAKVGTTVGNISQVLNPFVGAAKPLSWPGASAGVTNQQPSSAVSQLIGIARPNQAKYKADPRGALTLSPSGYASPTFNPQGSDNTSSSNQVFALNVIPTSPGSEAVYNGGTAMLTDTNQKFPEGVPVGSFDPSKVANQGAASYVPLGAYGEVASTIGSGADKGRTLEPSVTGMGLVSSRTAAIGSISSAAKWGATAPIDAIRVRVAGISAYSSAAVQKVVEVARRIKKLGLNATVVAGSSLTDAKVGVNGYAFGTADPTSKQTVGNLGTVTQRWSELGAASRVSLSVSTASYLILGVGLLASALLLAAAQFAGLPARRRQAVTMRELGFTRARISTWYASEELPALAVVVLVGVLAVWLSAGRAITLVTVLIAAGVVLLAAAASVVASARNRSMQLPRDARSRRIGARSLFGFGVRQGRVHPLTSVLDGIAVLIVGLAAAGLLIAVQTGRQQSGNSALATITIAQLVGPQLALGAAGIIGGILLARLMRRIDLTARADQWATLRATGWTSRQLAFVQRIEAFTIGLPAVTVAALLTWAGAVWLNLQPAWLYICVAAGASAVTAAVSASTRTRGKAT